MSSRFAAAVYRDASRSLALAGALAGLFIAVPAAAQGSTGSTTVEFLSGGPAREGYASAQVTLNYRFFNCGGQLQLHLAPVSGGVVTGRQYWAEGKSAYPAEASSPPRYPSFNAPVQVLSGYQVIARSRVFGPSADVSMGCYSGYSVDVGPMTSFVPATATETQRNQFLATLRLQVTGSADRALISDAARNAMARAAREAQRVAEQSAAQRAAQARADSIARARAAQQEGTTPSAETSGGASPSDSTAAASRTGDPERREADASAAGRVGTGAGGTPPLETTPSGPRYENGRCIGTWWECETPEQARERLRLSAERDIARTRQLVRDADAAYERQQFREALALYRRAAYVSGGYVAVREERQHARDRIAYLSENLETLEYAAFSAASGYSWGVAAGGSHLKADPFGALGGLFGVEVKVDRPTLTTMWSVGTSRVVLGQLWGEEGAFDSAGEFTTHFFGVTAVVPGVRVGNFGLHGGYRFQRTNRRNLHLMTTGILWGVDRGPGFRLDVTPVYGKPVYGFAILLDFSNMFD